MYDKVGSLVPGAGEGRRRRRLEGKREVLSSPARHSVVFLRGASFPTRLQDANPRHMGFRVKQNSKKVKKLVMVVVTVNGA